MARISRHDGSDLRMILAGMVVDRFVCARIASQWRPEGLFRSPWANLVGGWCVRYYERYGQPPNGHLRSQFESWADGRSKEDKTINAVESFLRHLSDEYEQDGQQNSEYLLDLAGEHFNRNNLQRVIDVATEDLEQGDVDKAHERMSTVARVELGEGSMVRPASDFPIWRAAFDSDRGRSLIGYPGLLNDFLGQWMVRESLIAFMGPDKTGKSVWLMDVAYRAIRERCKVVYFDMGDMSRNDVLKRLGQRAARKSLFRQAIRVPKSVTSEGDVAFKKRRAEKRLTPGEAFKAFRKRCRNRDVFRLACYPNDSMDVMGLAAVLRDWERQGWVPDVVVVDYADIIADPPGASEKLDVIDTNWKRLRRISQEFHCLVVTATQSNAAAYGNQGVLTRKHFSGRKTKLAHVNGMIGLNVTAAERENGVARINWIVRREGHYSETRCLKVAGCYDIFNPAMKSSR